MAKRFLKYLSESIVNANEWLKELGVATFLIGFVGTISIPEMFWISVVLCFAGYLMLVTDAWLDQKLLFRVKAFFVVFATALMVYFAISFVFVSADLTVRSSVLLDPPLTPDPIPWKENFSPLKVDFFNTSKVRFDDIVLVIKPTEPVTGATILGGPSDATCRPFDVDYPTVSMLDGEGKLAKHNPLVLIATDGGYAIRCANLLPGERLSIILALSRTHWDGIRALPAGFSSFTNSIGSILGPEFLMNNSKVPNVHTFFGHTNYNLYGPIHWPFRVKISGSYVAEFQKRHILIDEEPYSEVEQARLRHLSHSIDRPD